MLRCVSRYRNAAIGLYVEPGEVLRELDAERETFLLRDSPGSFERYEEPATATRVAALESPPADRMVKRERAARKTGERGGGGAMSSGDMPGLVPPKG